MRRPSALGAALSAGDLDAGLVVPSNFAKRRMNGETAEIQILVDGVNSNTAAIAGGYATRIVSALNQKLTVVQGSNGTPAQASRKGASSRVLLLYNPGLKNSWFLVTGMIGMLLVMLGIAVSSSAMVKEKEVDVAGVHDRLDGPEHLALSQTIELAAREVQCAFTCCAHRTLTSDEKLRSVRVVVVVVAVTVTATVAITAALVAGKRVGHLKMLPQSRQSVRGEGF